MKGLSRKGLAIQDIAAIGMTLVVIGAIIAIGVWINSDFAKNTFTGTGITGQSWSLTNGSATALYAYVRSIEGVYNTTGPLTGGSATSNWSYVPPNSLLLSCGAAYCNTTGTWKVNYTVNNETGYLATQNATAGMSSLAQWMPIIALVLAAAIVIGVLVSWKSNSGM